MYSNMTPRGSRIPGVNGVVVLGIQYYALSTLIDIWNEDFFAVPFEEIEAEFMQEMEEYTLSRAAAEAIGVEHWRALHKLGYLPLSIKALPEGTICPIKVPCYTVRETKDEYFWLTNFIETDMSSEVWGCMTSATLAHEFNKVFMHWADVSGAPKELVKFQGHNFSYRGMLGREAAAIVDMGHLLSFVGSDTIPGRKYLKRYYKADQKKGIISCSVFATEHAVMCSATGFYIKKNGIDWEKYGEAEFEVFKRLITEVYPTGFLSIVSDTWNLWVVLRDYLPRLRDIILAREGRIIIRPDSGDPVKIMTGYLDGEFEKDGEDYYPLLASQVRPGSFTRGKKMPGGVHEVKGVIQCLFDVFGADESLPFGMNEKGFIRLNGHVSSIYGDSINIIRANEICQRLVEGRNFESTSWVAGIGSYTYQYVTRDTFSFAQKATNTTVEIDGERIDIPIFKKPVTGDGSKDSAAGLIHVDLVSGKYVMKDRCTWEEEATGYLIEVFRDSKMTKEYELEEMRASLKATM